MAEFQAEVKDRALVSAFVICFNEAKHIKECLDSLSFCDEVVVVDSYSTDDTVEIARACGARVIQRQWPGYRAQKAFALSQVTHEWVVNIDADERVSEELACNIINVLRDLKNGNKQNISNSVVGYYINRVVFYFERWWRRGGWYPEYRLRFFRKSKITWGGVDPHEKPIPDGATKSLSGEIYHYTYENLQAQLNQLMKFAFIAAEQDFKRGRRAKWYNLLISPLCRIFRFFILKGGYREGVAGWIVAASEGFYTFMKYARLWEMWFYHDREECVRTQREKEECGVVKSEL